VVKVVEVVLVVVALIVVGISTVSSINSAPPQAENIKINIKMSNLFIIQ
jgi:hypothetical protein